MSLGQRQKWGECDDRPPIQTSTTQAGLKFQPELLRLDFAQMLFDGGCVDLARGSVELGAW